MISAGMFHNCSQLSSVVIGEDVETIGNEAFSSCELGDVKFLTKKLISIGRAAFLSSNLSAASLPDTVTSIGSSAFAKTNITHFDVPPLLTEISSGLFDGCSFLSSVKFKGNNITSIGSSAFRGTSLTSNLGMPSETFTIPDSVTTIGSVAFQNSNLCDVFYPAI